MRSSKSSVSFVTVAAMIGLAATAASAQQTIEYPLVFGDRAKLRQLGLVEESFGPEDDDVSGFENKCHDYGAGGYLISVSDELLASYRSRGFSLPSLCMGLVSAIRFDPGTGARLPTYVIADFKRLAVQTNEDDRDSDTLSAELPLVVPDCFSRGMPLKDCTFDFDPWTGRRISDGKRQKMLSAGAVIEKTFLKRLLEGWYEKTCICEDLEEHSTEAECRRDTVGECESDDSDGWLGVELGNVWPLLEAQGFDSVHSIGFVDVSSEFPMGFGIAIGADGTGGPSADNETVETAQEGKKRTSDASIEATAEVMKRR